MYPPPGEVRNMLSRALSDNRFSERLRTETLLPQRRSKSRSCSTIPETLASRNNIVSDIISNNNISGTVTEKRLYALESKQFQLETLIRSQHRVIDRQYELAESQTQTIQSLESNFGLLQERLDTLEAQQSASALPVTASVRHYIPETTHGPIRLTFRYEKPAGSLLQNYDSVVQELHQKLRQRQTSPVDG